MEIIQVGERRRAFPPLSPPAYPTWNDLKQLNERSSREYDRLPHRSLGELSLISFDWNLAGRLNCTRHRDLQYHLAGWGEHSRENGFSRKDSCILRCC